MEKTSISDTVKDATDRLRGRATDLGEQTTRVVRENAPRARQALSQGYDETAGAVRALAASRAVQGIAIAAALGLLIGLFLTRRQ